MGRCISLYSSAAIGPDEFLLFIAAIGGQIIDEEAIDGRISSGDCHVWFYAARAGITGKFEEPTERVETKLGAPVKVRVDLNLSHHEGSGPLALQFAYDFARRWPAVAACAVCEVLTVTDVKELLSDPHGPLIASAAIRILSTTAPDLVGAIGGVGGITIDANDIDMVASAQKEIGAMEGAAAYDSRRDQIVGFVPSENAYLWILRSAVTSDSDKSSDDPDERLSSIVVAHLGTRPSEVICVLMGYGASDESDHTALVFSERILQSQLGVVVGIFHSILDAARLGQMLESGRGTFIA